MRICLLLLSAVAAATTSKHFPGVEFERVHTGVFVGDIFPLTISVEVPADPEKRLEALTTARLGTMDQGVLRLQVDSYLFACLVAAAVHHHTFLHVSWFPDGETVPGVVYVGPRKDSAMWRALRRDMYDVVGTWTACDGNDECVTLGGTSGTLQDVIHEAEARLSAAFDAAPPGEVLVVDLMHQSASKESLEGLDFGDKVLTTWELHDDTYVFLLEDTENRSHTLMGLARDLAQGEVVEPWASS